jgi:hypothetical protein
MKRPLHLISEKMFTTLCGKSAARTHWVRIEEDVTCSECLRFIEGRKLREAAKP